MTEINVNVPDDLMERTAKALRTIYPDIDPINNLDAIRLGLSMMLVNAVRSVESREVEQEYNDQLTTSEQALSEERLRKFDAIYQSLVRILP